MWQTRDKAESYFTCITFSLDFRLFSKFMRKRPKASAKGDTRSLVINWARKLA